MLGWFAPAAPVNTREKTWTELRMKWLANQFGIERMLSTSVILPTNDFFPEPFHGTRDDSVRLFGRMCSFMEIDPAAIELTFDDDPQGVRQDAPLGLYYDCGRPVISLAERIITEPMQVLATLSHELSHYLLLSRKLIDAAEQDHEYVTDLLPVFLGVGVFCANTVLSDQSYSDGHWHWWSISRQGYLNARIFGYGLALFAWLRGETKPRWSNHLRRDVRVVFRQGLRYLQKTGDSRFSPENPRANVSRCQNGLLKRVQASSNGEQLAALWECREHRPVNNELLVAVSSCLANRDPVVRTEAAFTLAVLAQLNEIVESSLWEVLRDGEAEVRAAAAMALGRLQCRPEQLLEELELMLTEKNRLVLNAAGQALRPFGTAAAKVADRVLEALSDALIDCHYPTIDALLETLRCICTNPKERLARRFQKHDREFVNYAIKLLDSPPVEPENLHWDGTPQGRIPRPVPFALAPTVPNIQIHENRPFGV